MKNIIKSVACTITGTCEDSPLNQIRKAIVLAESTTKQIKQELKEVRQVLHDLKAEHHHGK